MYRFGERVIDTVTGFTGKVTARLDQYGRGPIRFKVERNGTTGVVSEWFDESRLESQTREENNACYLPRAELVEEIPLGRNAEEIEKTLGAMLNEKA